MPAAKKSAPGKTGADWRAGTLARIRTLAGEADPAITEDRKWKKPSNPAGVPTFERDVFVA